MNVATFEHILQIVTFTTILVITFNMFNKGQSSLNNMSEKDRKMYLTIFYLLLAASLYWPIKNRRLRLHTVLKVVIYGMIICYLSKCQSVKISAGGFQWLITVVLIMNMLPLCNTMKYDVEDAIKKLVKKLN